MDDGFEVPTMNVLIKDHKNWSSTSNKPIPSRPLVSGRKGLNTHLSELISEILDPIALHMEGGEVQSTDEALAIIDKFNKEVERGTDLTRKSYLSATTLEENGTLIYNLAPDSCCAQQQKRHSEQSWREFNNFYHVSDSPLTYWKRKKRVQI